MNHARTPGQPEAAYKEEAAHNREATQQAVLSGNVRGVMSTPLTMQETDMLITFMKQTVFLGAAHPAAVQHTTRSRLWGLIQTKQCPIQHIVANITSH